MAARMKRVEREISHEVDLCRPDGRLNPDAVGWTRHPAHRANLRGWGRTKRWEYWGLTTPTHVVAATVAALDYAGIGQVWVLDRATGTELDKVVIVPFARGVVLPERSGPGAGPTRFASGGLTIELTDDTTGTALRLRTDRVDAQLRAHRPAGHESLGVVVPWSERRFQYTVKDLARPLTGRLRLDGVEVPVPAGSCWAVLDHGRGRWPYAMTWNWGAASGVVDGRVIGVQIGGKWTDGTGSTENGLFVDGRLHKIGEDLTWSYDRRDWLAPWRISGERVDVRFIPYHERAALTDFGVIRSETHQCFGHYEGWLIDDSGERIRVDGVDGWAEETRNRW
jgi:hypothetical protein